MEEVKDEVVAEEVVETTEEVTPEEVAQCYGYTTI